mgnify:CR=1 FL=1
MNPTFLGLLNFKNYRAFRNGSPYFLINNWSRQLKKRAIEKNLPPTLFIYFLFHKHKPL